MKILAPLVLLLLMTACAGIIENREQNNDQQLDNYRKKTIPAQEIITEFRIAIAEAQMNAMFWLNTPGQNAIKTDLATFISVDYPALKSEILQLEKDSAFPVGTDIQSLLAASDALLADYSDLMLNLNEVMDYEDPTMVFNVIPLFEADGKCVVGYDQVTAMSEDIAEILQQHANAQLATFTR